MRAGGTTESSLLPPVTPLKEAEHLLSILGGWPKALPPITCPMLFQMPPGLDHGPFPPSPASLWGRLPNPSAFRTVFCCGEWETGGVWDVALSCLMFPSASPHHVQSSSPYFQALLQLLRLHNAFLVGSNDLTAFSPPQALFRQPLSCFCTWNLCGPCAVFHHKPEELYLLFSQPRGLLIFLTFFQSSFLVLFNSLVFC